MFELKQTPEEGSCTCEAHVVELVDPGFVQSLTREYGVEAKPVLDDDVEDVLVEVVHDDERNPPMALSPMEKQ